MSKEYKELDIQIVEEDYETSLHEGYIVKETREPFNLDVFYIKKPDDLSVLMNYLALEQYYEDVFKTEILGRIKRETKNNNVEKAQKYMDDVKKIRKCFDFLKKTIIAFSYERSEVEIRNHNYKIGVKDE